MAKSRKNRSFKFLKNIKKNSAKAIPVINTGLKNVGVAAKNVASASIPIIENSVSSVYGTINKGVNLGVKGARNVSRGFQSISKKKRHNRRRKTRKH
jgi:hypothetical protein